MSFTASNYMLHPPIPFSISAGMPLWMRLAATAAPLPRCQGALAPWLAASQWAASSSLRYIFKQHRHVTHPHADCLYCINGTAAYVPAYACLTM